MILPEGGRWTPLNSTCCAPGPIMHIEFLQQQIRNLKLTNLGSWPDQGHSAGKQQSEDTNSEKIDCPFPSSLPWIFNSMIFSTFKWHHLLWSQTLIIPSLTSHIPCALYSCCHPARQLSRPWALPFPLMSSGFLCFPTQPTLRVCHFNHALSLDSFAPEFLPSYLSLRHAPGYRLFLVGMVSS